ncbi:MAG: hypothetical protein WCR42_00950 [bacterium]
MASKKIKQAILDYSIKWWIEKSIRITSSDISEKFNLPNEQVMLILEDLESEQKGSLTRNQTDCLIKIEMDEETYTAKISEPIPITVHYFTPSRIILRDHYEKHRMDFENNGEYKNRLILGYSQLELIYFSLEALHKYTDQTEKYIFDDNISGGEVRFNSIYLNDITEDEQEKIFFEKIWFGKRQQRNGEIAIAVILYDLSVLPITEQQYWASYEIKNGTFMRYDKNFDLFFSRTFDGNWEDVKDPLYELSKNIIEINDIFGKEIFTISENQYLRYLVKNTYKEFLRCNSELFKLLDNGHLNVRYLKDIYLNFCKGDKNNLTHKDSKRDLTSLQVLKLIMESLNTDLSNRYFKHIEKINVNRIADAHKTSVQNPKKINYIDQFTKICYETKNLLVEIKRELLKLKNNYEI